MLRLNDAIHVASALFVDELFDQATDFATRYKALPAFKENKQLYNHWTKLSPEIPVGEAWRFGNAFAEVLGMRGGMVARHDV